MERRGARLAAQEPRGVAQPGSARALGARRRGCTPPALRALLRGRVCTPSAPWPPCSSARIPTSPTLFPPLPPVLRISAPRGVAQPGSARSLGARRRGFESRLPDKEEENLAVGAQGARQH